MCDLEVRFVISSAYHMTTAACGSKKITNVRCGYSNSVRVFSKNPMKKLSKVLDKSLNRFTVLYELWLAFLSLLKKQICVAEVVTLQMMAVLRKKWRTQLLVTARSEEDMMMPRWN